jgi:hypothetical protein
MSNVDNQGCGCLILVLFVASLIWLIGTLAFWVINIFASIGTTFIFFIDYLAYAFTGIGINNPAIGWLLLGFLLGGTVGLVQGLKRTRHSSYVYVVYVIAAILFLLLQTVAYSKWQSQFDLSVFEKITLQETFTSPHHWTLAEGAAFKEESLLQISPQEKNLSWSSWGGQTFSDMDFSADVQKNNGSDHLYFGLIARLHEGKNPSFYYLQINGNGSVVMGKYVDNQWNDKVGPKEIDSVNTWNSQNHLRVVCQGHLMMGFVNDQLVGIFRDTSYDSGKIALQTSRNSESSVVVNFDNVVVKEKAL